jgi:hypothetical protein
MTDHTPRYAGSELDTLTCQQVTALLVDYVTADMAPSMRTAFEAHVQDCTDCLAFLNTYKETIRATHTVRYQDIPGEMLNRVQQFLRTKMPGPHSR